MKTYLFIFLLISFCTNHKSFCVGKILKISEIKSCTEKIYSSGETIDDQSLHNIMKRTKIYFNVDFNNISIYREKDNPSSLVETIMMKNMRYPVQNVKGDPRCILISCSSNSKISFAICIPKDEVITLIHSIHFLYQCSEHTEFPTVVVVEKLGKRSKKCLEKIRDKYMKLKNNLNNITQN
jgi:hypothetical protein